MTKTFTSKYLFLSAEYLFPSCKNLQSKTKFCSLLVFFVCVLVKFCICYESLLLALLCVFASSPFKLTHVAKKLHYFHLIYNFLYASNGRVICLLGFFLSISFLVNTFSCKLIDCQTLAKQTHKSMQVFDLHSICVLFCHPLAFTCNDLL